jgi:hypothetical protein
MALDHAPAGVTERRLAAPGPLVAVAAILFGAPRVAAVCAIGAGRGRVA